MATSSGPAPAAVQNAIQDYLTDLGQYFSTHGLTYTATCEIVAGTSVDNQIWEAGALPDQAVFVGSAVKTFMLAEYLRSGLSESSLALIDDSIRSISSTVFGDETLAGQPYPDLVLQGQTLVRNVLEAMISHSDNTATDSILAAVGADRVRELIEEVGLSSVQIPESTRRLFTYLASGENKNVDWDTLKSLVENPPNPQDAINGVQSMMASAADMVRWYQTALQDSSFFTPAALAEFKRISAMADALHLIVPENLASYGKGGSITWNDFGCITVSGQMEMPTTDPGRPWVPLTFSFNINWGSDDPQIFDEVAGILVGTARQVLSASLDAFYWTSTDFVLTVAADNLTGTAGRDDFAGPGGGLDQLYGLGGDDSFSIRASQTGLISGGDGYDTVNAIDDRLSAGLTLDTVEALNASETNLHASVAQLGQFSRIVAPAGRMDFHLFLRDVGGVLDLSTRFVSPILLHVDAAEATSQVTVVGTSHDDDLSGSSHDDTLIGGQGNDALSGGDGTDYLYGQAGDDRLSGGGTGAAPNQLWGGEGSDTASYAGITGTVYADIALQAGLVDGALADTMNSIENLTGGSGTNTLVGDASANVLRGGSGIDYLYGQDGDDSLIGGAAPVGATNQLWGGSGSDTASYAGTGGAVYADLAVQAGYVGGTLVDQMNSIENLTGSSNADILAGDGGANRIAGGGGADSLWGRGGVDVFVFSAYADSNLATGYDTIGDFVSGVSKLDFRALATDASHVLIQSDGTSTSVYVEKTPGQFNASTDLAIAVIGADAVAMGDILFT